LWRAADCRIEPDVWRLDGDGECRELHMSVSTRGRPPGKHVAPRRTAGDTARAAMPVRGKLMVSLGVIGVLFIVYELYVSGLVSAGRQQEATQAPEDQPTLAQTSPASEPTQPLAIDGLLRLYAPALGPGFTHTVREGTDQDTLATGPGHYRRTALPGQPGNVAIAGHRVTHGAPFNRIDQLESCDALIVETAREWFVYRVLPMRDELSRWAEGKGAQPRCHGVTPLPAPYPEVPGQEIVRPSDVSVIAAVPGLSRDVAGASAQMITLTTCHPKFSARQRLIVHGVLVAQYPTNGAPPAELMEE
jgi:sortase A